MIVIADSNVIISALISPNGVVAGIFSAKSNLQFLAPNYLFEEVDKHIVKIIKMSPLSKKEILEMVEIFKKRIKVIYTKEIPQKYIIEAFDIVEGIDIDDVYFVALNRYTKHKLWTSDKELIKGVEAKGYKIFVTTEELKKKLYKKK
jgi:predicted nucleic acid-binding protein